MRIGEENWKVLASLFPTGWRQIAWQSRAVARLRGFPSPDVLLRMLLLHVARGYSFRENVACRLEEAISRTIRIVDGTIVREPGKTGSQWRILYSVRLPTTGTCP